MSTRPIASAAPNASAAAGTYRRLIGRRVALLSAAGALLVACVIGDLMTGPARLSLAEVWAVLCQPRAGETPDMNWTIVWTLRMPTALAALLIGTALATAGAQMQTILNNPLASPFTLGVSAAAGFGAALAIVCGGAIRAVLGIAPTGGPAGLIELAAVPVSAFAFAMLCSLTVYAIGRAKGGGAESVILAGVAILFLFNAAVSLLQYLATDNQLQAIVHWTFGTLQFGQWAWQKLAILAAVLVGCLPLILRSAWKLTALRLGEHYAASLGIDVRRLRLGSLMIASVLTATAVCFAGTIGFVGLVAPHLARVLVGEDQRFFLPMSALTGAALLSAASLASKLVLPGATLPIGIATAVLGVPFFLTMVLASRRRHW